MSIPKSEKDRIRQLKAEGFSQRDIARMTGHSRNTVADILGTPAGDDDARRREREARRQLAEAPPERCPGCGRKVTFPCALCLARNYRELKKRQSECQPREEPMDRRPPPGIELHGSHDNRYQEVHDRKKQRGRIPWER